MLILEPVNFNCGGIVPEPGYLELARKLTEQAGIVLFFDEIQSAFKKSTACAQGELAEDMKRRMSWQQRQSQRAHDGDGWGREEGVRQTDRFGVFGRVLLVVNSMDRICRDDIII